MLKSNKGTLFTGASVVADIHSVELNLQSSNSAGLHVECTGSSISATVQAYVSNDPDALATTNTGWAALGSAVSLPSGGGSVVIPDLVAAAPYLKAKVFLDYTSGTLTTAVCRAVTKG